MRGSKLISCELFLRKARVSSHFLQQSGFNIDGNVRQLSIAVYDEVQISFIVE